MIVQTVAVSLPAEQTMKCVVVEVCQGFIRMDGSYGAFRGRVDGEPCLGCEATEGVGLNLTSVSLEACSNNQRDG